jgi:hypothetical protein
LRSFGQPRDELREHLEVLGALPVDPGDLVVLGVDVVVAALRAAELVAVQQHRHALRQEQRGEEVALLLLPQRDDLEVVGLALDAAVPAAVVALAVVAALAVGLVVLLVVGDEVVHREAVVRGDEVDGGVRPAAVVLVEVGRPGEPDGELASVAGSPRQ